MAISKLTTRELDALLSSVLREIKKEREKKAPLPFSKQFRDYWEKDREGMILYTSMRRYNNAIASYNNEAETLQRIANERLVHLSHWNRDFDLSPIDIKKAKEAWFEKLFIDRYINKAVPTKEQVNAYVEWAVLLNTTSKRKLIGDVSEFRKTLKSMIKEDLGL